MTMQERVKELSAEFQEVKKLEAEFKMKIGKYDDKAKVLLKELGFHEKAEMNVIEVLSAAFSKQ
jgi:hypothetical protein